MSGPRSVAVIDIGKTNAKLAIVDLAARAERAVLTRPNTVLRGPPYPHFDVDAIWSFLLESLRTLGAAHPVDALSVTTHGASGALLTGEGDLAAPVLDYEYDGPDALAEAYDDMRPPFAETGSPRLPGGLNLGAQLHWQLARDGALRRRIAHVVTYPQYWVSRLTGQIVSERTSLGCHTDLWAPRANDYSALPARLGLADAMAPLAPATRVIGAVQPEIAAQAGLAEGAPVFCGVHDSNASLYAHLLSRRPPFAVVSTGTWVISMAVGGATKPLDPARDTLMNVDALGRPTPSARFMGGRELDLLLGGRAPTWTAADLQRVVSRRVLATPGLVSRTGPYPDRRAAWSVDPADLSAGERAAAALLYLAMMTSVCLEIIGAEGPVLVEGPMAASAPYRQMLASATGRDVLGAGASTGASIGAALLAAGAPSEDAAGAADETTPPVSEMLGYAAAWRAAVA